MLTTERSVQRDASGAILVSAVFMAAVLVGALWAVVGIGDAILHRQSLQSSADAVAFAGALYHARGMNLIALINVVMSGIMAVLVALKLVAALNLAALVLSCSASALCSVGVGCWAVPICAFTGDLKPEIDSAAAARPERRTTTRRSPTQRSGPASPPWSRCSPAPTI